VRNRRAAAANPARARWNAERRAQSILNDTPVMNSVSFFLRPSPGLLS
jgi:hypothetical protein